VAPVTRHIGLIPVATVTHTEPFHVSKAIATLDFVSHGRAGWQVRVSGTQHEAELFGRRDVSGIDLFEEASDAVEVVRRLWDSWEDDAVIRDVSTGRYVDRDKLHYIDFTGKYFSVKGPSITPRPPQGQPVVAALAHATRIYEFASRSADLVFVTPQDDVSLQAILSEIADLGGAGLKVYADIFVSFSYTTDPRSDALVFDGTPAELVDLLLRWQQQGVDGVRLRPAVNATDLPAIVDEGVLAARHGGRRARRQLGHPPAHRPAAVTRAHRQEVGSVTIREGKHRKPIHLAAHFPGVNNTTVWSDPESGSQRPARRPDRRRRRMARTRAGRQPVHPRTGHRCHQPPSSSSARPPRSPTKSTCTCSRTPATASSWCPT
jgi:alkanesulfonate monooxygenase SsuD/methylene tetrahydromethanopterin reductase-like flavin-dependent oxidoreductase (luciferase family)